MSADNDISDVGPVAAFTALSENPDAVLIDVRTDVEWQHVGIPSLPESNSNLHFISWQQTPDMRINGSFIEDMAAAGVSTTAPIYFLCRSGVRSRAAAIAATSAGYGPCYNVAEGFEGMADPDGNRHGGWQGNRLSESKPA